MSRTMIDADVLKQKLNQKVFLESGDECCRSVMKIIDDLANRENCKHHCRECLHFCDRRKNERGTLLGRCKLKKHREYETYGSMQACIEFEKDEVQE